MARRLRLPVGIHSDRYKFLGDPLVQARVGLSEIDLILADRRHPLRGRVRALRVLAAVRMASAPLHRLLLIRLDVALVMPRSHLFTHQDNEQKNDHEYIIKFAVIIIN